MFAATTLAVLLSAASVGAQHDDKLAPTGASRLTQQPAPAPTPAASARVEVLVLEGTAGDGGVAASLANIPQLRLAPFNAYTQIALVSRVTLPLAGTPSTAPLPNGGSARVTLAGRSADGRYTVDVAFVQGAQTSTIQFVAGAGEPFFTVRSRRPDRALIFGFIVRP
jgi:hypothetical protein